MYSILIMAPYQNDEEEGDQPVAIDPKLCTHLSDERDVQIPLEQPLMFQIGPLALEREYLHILNAMGYLCSEHFIKVLREASVPFTVYPAQVFEMGTNNLIAARYYFWLPNRVKRKDIVDWEHTKMHIEPETGFSRVARLVLQSDRLGTVPLLFQVGGRILVHETLRATLEAEGIRGLAFAPLDMAYSPYDALRILAMQRQLQEHPDDWALWYELSRGLTASGKYDEALDALEHVLALNPTYAEAWHQRGRTLHQMGRLQEALEALQQAITLDPLNWAWRERCQILQEQGRNEEALACAEHLVVIKDKAYFS